MGKEENRLVLLVSILVLIVLIICVAYLKKINNKDTFFSDYSQIDYSSLFLVAKKVENKNLYWTLDDIISNFMLSYYEEGIVYYDADVSYEEYYEVLSRDYKAYIDKAEYVDIAKRFFDNFITRNDYEAAVVDSVGILDTVYEIEKDVYLCDLSSKQTNKKSFIVIKLYTSEDRFEIMYIG